MLFTRSRQLPDKDKATTEEGLLLRLPERIPGDTAADQDAAASDGTAVHEEATAGDAAGEDPDEAVAGRRLAGQAPGRGAGRGAA